MNEPTQTEDRIQKILAQAGYGSRRACEELITTGRVSVNGRIVTLGEKADAQRDSITLDGKPINLPEKIVYIALNKPVGVLSAVSTPDDRKTVRDLVNLPVRLYPVGRLDFDSEGLIILTNDGETANRLTHPRYGHEKEYRVLVARRPDQEQLDIWRRGVVLADKHRTAPASVEIDGMAGSKAWLRIVMREGRKRQIREVGSRIGLPVVKIIRLRVGPIQLGHLKSGNWRYLSSSEIAELQLLPKQKPPEKKPVKPKKIT
jgi:23S rRNA pseudouridine2605 synthase